MPVFAYTARDTAAETVRGTIVADTPRQARDALRAHGLTIQHVDQENPSKQGLGRLVVWRGVPAAQIIVFYRELSTLLAVGIPLLEALGTVARQHEGRMKSIVLTLRDRVSAGISLAQALAEHPRVFDEVARSIVEVGEQAGTLEDSLQRLAEFRERSSQLKGRIATALTYPCIVLCMGLGVSVFLMTYVVPNLLTAITDAGRQLPLSTKIVKTMSDLLVNHWWVLALLAGLAAFAIAGLLRSRRAIIAWHRLELRLPLLGELVRKQAVARVAMVMATLLRSGLTFVDALKLTQKLVRNSVLRQALIDCETAVYAGRDIAEALGSRDNQHVIPPTVVQVFAVGQESGQLESMLERLSKDYDQQVQAAAQRLTSVLEPLLILVLAVVVGFIAFATIMPILEVSDVL